MKLIVNFKQANPEFDKDYAFEYHGGEESDGNWKYLWAKEYGMESDIDKILLIEEEVLEGEKGANISIPEMTILECYKGDKVINRFAVSKVLIRNTHEVYNPKHNTTRFYFYFNERNDYSEIVSGLFVVNKDISV